MRRQLQPVDLIVAVGVFATVIGGYCLLLSTNGMILGQPPVTTEIEPPVSGPLVATQWVQPALGHAIVDAVQVEQTHEIQLRDAVRELNQSALAADYAGQAVNRSTQDVMATAARLDAEQAGRVQYVMGRAIMIGTARGIRGHLFSGDYVDDPYNTRLISRVEAMGQGMMDRYANARESMLGSAIVERTQDAVRFMDESQERLGSAIGSVIRLQDGITETIGAAQQQLALVALASFHHEQVADRFAALTDSERAMEAPATVMEARAWPDAEFGWLALGSLGLVGLFFIGLLMPTARPEPTVTVEAPTVPYRKTA